MRLIAIDPGFERMGVAVFEKNKEKEGLLFSDCITTDKKFSFQERLSFLSSRFKEISKEWSVEVCALEKLFFNKNQKTAMQVAETRGMLIEVSNTMNLEIFEYSPSEIKVAVTGYGSASKAQVADMVKKLVSMKHIPKFDDEYDAIAVGLTCLASEKSLI